MCLSFVCYVTMELRLTITSSLSVITLLQFGCFLLPGFGLTRLLMCTQQQHGSGSLNSRASRQATCLIKLVFQSAIYHIWKERNARIFTSRSSPPATTRAAIDRQIRDRLLSIPPSPRVQPSFLQFFFACTRPPWGVLSLFVWGCCVVSISC